MIKFIKTHYSPIILSILMILSIVFLALSVSMVNAKVWILYIDHKREVADVQMSNNGLPILKDAEPFAYYLGYTSIVMFSVLIILIGLMFAFKFKMKLKHNKSSIHISWQWKVVFALFIGLAIFFFAYSSYYHYNLAFSEWRATQTHIF